MENVLLYDYEAFHDRTLADCDDSFDLTEDNLPLEDLVTYNRATRSCSTSPVHRPLTGIDTSYAPESKFVTFMIGPDKKIFVAERHVMCSLSPMFNKAFNGNFLEAGTQEMVIDDIEPDSFELLCRSPCVQEYRSKTKCSDTDAMVGYKQCALPALRVHELGRDYGSTVVKALGRYIARRGRDQDASNKPSIIPYQRIMEECQIWSKYAKEELLVMGDYDALRPTRKDCGSKMSAALNRERRIDFHCREIWSSNAEDDLPHSPTEPRNTIIELCHLWLLADRMLMAAVKEDVLEHFWRYRPVQVSTKDINAVYSSFPKRAAPAQSLDRFQLSVTILFMRKRGTSSAGWASGLHADVMEAILSLYEKNWQKKQGEAYCFECYATYPEDPEIPDFWYDETIF